MLRLGRENPFCHKTPGPRIRDLVLNVTKVQNWPKKVATLVILREKLFVFTKLVIFCGWERSQPFNTCQTLQKLPQIGQKIENMPKTQIGVGKFRILLQFRDCLTDGISVWTGSISVVYLLYLLKERIEQHFQSKATTQRYMFVCVIFQTLSVWIKAEVQRQWWH